jgi:hypothetical protein
VISSERSAGSDSKRRGKKGKKGKKGEKKKAKGDTRDE